MPHHGGILPEPLLTGGTVRLSVSALNRPGEMDAAAQAVALLERL
jgi:hypothetical protein